MEFKNLLALIEAVSASELTGLKYEEKGIKVQLTKTKDEVQLVQAQTPQVLQVPEAAAEVVAEVMSGQVVKCPLVGTFYTAPSEDLAPFVAVGDTVKVGQTLAIVEAMKLMNEIESEFDGTIVEVLVENGQAVEYGQPLFRIK